MLKCLSAGCAIAHTVHNWLNNLRDDVLDASLATDGVDLSVCGVWWCGLMRARINKSDAFAQYWSIMSLVFHSLSNNRTLASDGVTLMLLLSCSTVSFNNLSTSSTFKQVNSRYSGSFFFGSICSMSMSTNPAKSKKKKKIRQLGEEIHLNYVSCLVAGLPLYFHNIYIYVYIPVL